MFAVVGHTPEDFSFLRHGSCTEMFGTGKRHHGHGIFQLTTPCGFAVGEASCSAFYLLLLVNFHPNFSEEIFSLIKVRRLR